MLKKLVNCGQFFDILEKIREGIKYLHRYIKEGLDRLRHFSCIFVLCRVCYVY
jgi:hypothetical protein